jgi:hypothetical protein
VPREWIEPPEYDTADGELLDEGYDASERSRMLRPSDGPRLIGEPEHGDSSHHEDSDWNSEEERRRGGNGKGKSRAAMRDSSGRTLPASERALPSRS